MPQDNVAPQDRVPVHRTVLSPQEIADYRRLGYINLSNGLDVPFVEGLAAATERLVERSRDLTEANRHFDLAPGHSPETPRLRRISSPTELDDIFVEAAFESVLGDIAADLVGGAVKFYHAKINFKLPSSEVSNIQWHQDWPHFPHTNTNLVALSIPFHARNRENGAVQIIPGSHTAGPLSIWRDGVYVFTCEGGIDPADLEQAVFLECGPGDVQAHHGLAVHASAPNPTDALCTTLTIQYAAADAFAYTAPVIDSVHRGAIVRGERSRFARVEAGMIELPPDFSAGYKSLFASQDDAEEAM
jgi:ectoine hydroxylase-related dioxygenase (phytanoyl-CoA dioxygenase family)